MSSIVRAAPVLAALVPLATAALVSLRPQTARAVVPATAAALVAAVVALVGTVMATDVARAGVVLGDGGRFVVGLGADRVGALIAVLTLAIGLVVLAAGTRAFEGDPRAARFGALGATLVGAVAVTALGATLTTVAIGWLATGLALVGLLRLGGAAPAVRDTVRRTTGTLAIGDAAFVTGIAVALATVGSIDLRDPVDTARAAGTDVAGLPVAELVAVLLVVAGIARSALLPAHRWLPSTVTAPTPVSALLHAGVVNGVGVLVLRTVGLTTESVAAMALLGAVGAATAIGATGVMLARADAKGALAWSTAGQMGFMAVQLAVGALASALFHLVGHAMYKAALFLGVGATVRAGAERRHLPVSTRPMRRMPRAAVAAAVPAASIVAALALFAPDLSPAAGVLVAGFGWWTAARLVDGWLATTDRRLAPVGVVIGVAAPVAYVGGMTLFKSFVGDTLPADTAGAIPDAVVVGAVATLVAAAGARRLLPVALRDRLAARVTSTLVAVGSPPVGRSVRRHPSVTAAATRPAAEPAPISLVPAPFHT